MIEPVTDAKSLMVGFLIERICKSLVLGYLFSH